MSNQPVKLYRPNCEQKQNNNNNCKRMHPSDFPREYRISVSFNCNFNEQSLTNTHTHLLAIVLFTVSELNKAYTWKLYIRWLYDFYSVLYVSFSRDHITNRRLPFPSSPLSSLPFTSAIVNISVMDIAIINKLHRFHHPL